MPEVGRRRLGMPQCRLEASIGILFSACHGQVSSNCQHVRLVTRHLGGRVGIHAIKEPCGSLRVAASNGDECRRWCRCGQSPARLIAYRSEVVKSIQGALRTSVAGFHLCCFLEGVSVDGPMRFPDGYL